MRFTRRLHWAGPGEPSNDFRPIVGNHDGALPPPLLIRLKLQRDITGNDLVKTINQHRRARIELAHHAQTGWRASRW